MFVLTVQTNFKEMAKQLRNVAQKQVKFALALAVNETTKAAVADFAKAMPRVFDRPVPFTVNAAFAIPVKNRDNVQAGAVALRFTAGKGTPAEKYLAAEILGGPRAVKRFERRLGWSPALGGLPGSGQTIPARGALLDQSGNMQRQQIGAVLGNLRAFGDTGQNISERKLRRLRKLKMLTRTRVGQAKYFVAKSKITGKPLGIWNVLGHGHVQPVLLFATKLPQYKPRLDFNALMGASFRKHFPEAFNRGMAKALSTAR